MEHQNPPQGEVLPLALLEKRNQYSSFMGKKLGRDIGGCVSCQSSTESVDHLFADYPSVTSVWRVPCNSLGVLPSHSSFKGLCLEWINRKFRKLAKSMVLVLIGAVTWSIWNEINGTFFRKKCHSISSVAYKALLQFNLWSNVMKTCWWSMEIAGTK